MFDQNQNANGGTVRLTAREQEILSLITDGHTSQKVANRLFVSKRTVDCHLANVYEKLQVNNRMQALREATRMGLLARAA